MIQSLLIAPERYRVAFAAERVNEYPVIDAIEREAGFAIDRQKLEAAARVLACPVKANPPNWQHGRAIYALTRAYLVLGRNGVTLLDIGTAKGFSALCLQWALDDSDLFGDVISVDVIDPKSHTLRNTVVECDGLKSLVDVLGPWPEANLIDFRHETGIGWLMDHPERVHVAFVDGKHSRDVVAKEAELLRDRQEPGDLVIFDDVQIQGVADAVGTISGYDVECVTVKPERRYAIARRR